MNAAESARGSFFFLFLFLFFSFLIFTHICFFLSAWMHMFSFFSSGLTLPDRSTPPPLPPPLPLQASKAYRDSAVAARPVWQSDETSSNCCICKNEFTFLNRRHHCRQCGVLCCGDCSTTRMQLAGCGLNKERVCDIWYEVVCVCT